MKKGRGFKYYTPKTKPEYWVSKLTSNRYEYSKYSNHGSGGIKNGFIDLPGDEYPYTLEYYPKKKALYL